jgi:hypothetical protein
MTSAEFNFGVNEEHRKGYRFDAMSTCLRSTGVYDWDKDQIDTHCYY